MIYDGSTFTASPRLKYLAADFLRKAAGFGGQFDKGRCIDGRKFSKWRKNASLLKAVLVTVRKKLGPFEGNYLS